MTSEEMDTVWAAVKDGADGHLHAMGVPPVVARNLSRIKRGNDWCFTDEMNDIHRKDKNYIHNGFAAAMLLQDSSSLKVEGCLPLIAEYMIPLMSHVAKKPRCFVTYINGEDTEVIKASGSTGLTAHLSDYRARCWAYVQLLTGGTEFTMAFSSGGPVFTLDVLVTKKIVNKTDNAVLKAEQDKALKSLLNSDPYYLYDTYILKSEAPTFEATEEFREIKSMDFVSSPGEVMSKGQEYIARKRADLAIQAKEVELYAAFYEGLKPRYPESAAATMTAVFVHIVDRAPTYIGLKDHWRTRDFTALAKIALKTGATGEELYARYAKLQAAKKAVEDAKHKE